LGARHDPKEQTLFIVDEQTDHGFVVRNAEGEAWHEPSNKVSRMHGRPEVKVEWVKPQTTNVACSDYVINYADLLKDLGEHNG